jgi:hypothetical protein
VSLDAGMSRRGAFNTLGPLPVLHSYRLRSPFGSAAALTAVSSPTSTFVPDLPGFYQVNVANNGTYPSQNVKHIGIGTGLQYDEAVHLETGGRLHYDPVLTDLDADGDTDFVVSGADRVTLARAIRVFLNTGGGFFTERQSFAFDDGAERILHGDLDGNGIVDLAAVGERTLFVVYNAATSSASTRQFALSRGVACTTISLFAEVTDANGDGDDDVLVVDACDHRVSIWTHTTGTTLVMSHQQTIANLIGYPIVFGDLNHDTRPDFVLPYAPGYPTPDAYVVYAQQSNHDFQVSATIETDLWTFSIGDASGDGLPDLVTSYAPNIRVFRQAAGGSLLTTPVVYDARSSFLPSPRFTDMNGDGLTDIVLTARADAMLLGLKQQNGSFTFLELPEDLLQGSGSNFALGDLDGNGIVDILRLRESFNDFGASVRFGVP